MATPNEFYGSGAVALVQRMGEAAADFLASLSTDQRIQTQLDFSDQSERTNWHYTPVERKGLPFTEMDRQQQRLAQKLVTTGLSRGGYNTATTIMGIETLLDAKEEWTAPLWWRDSKLYHVTIFGEPSVDKPWGWRFEGHHISLNYTIVGGQIVAPTPTFFGSNPARSPLGQTAWLRPLSAIEDLARELVYEFDEGQRASAVVTPIAPPDIVALNRPVILDQMLPGETPGIVDPSNVSDQFQNLEKFKQALGAEAEHLEAVRYTTKPKGIQGAQMSYAQQEILLKLIGEYIHRMPDELAEIEMAKVKEQGVDQIHFVWAGPIEPYQPHYYRLQGPRFLVEYDNVQNDANHIHSVWRDSQNDFGADILAHHYAHAH
ncbi:MAG: DUF3500 domain-containing protein [Chloroflexota bacterium]